MRRRWVKVAILVLVVGIGGWYGGHWLYWRWADSLPRGPAPPPGVIAWIKEVPGKKPLLVVDEAPGGKRLYQADCGAEEADGVSWSPDGRTVLVSGSSGYGLLLEFLRPFQPTASRLAMRLPGTQIPRFHTYKLAWSGAERVALADETLNFPPPWVLRLPPPLRQYAGVFGMPHSVVKTFRTFPVISAQRATELGASYVCDIYRCGGATVVAVQRVCEDGAVSPCLVRLSEKGRTIDETAKWLPDVAPGRRIILDAVRPKPGASELVGVALRAEQQKIARDLRVGLVDVDNKAWVEIMNAKSGPSRLAWSPDGKGILVTYLAPPDRGWGTWEIVLVRLHGRNTTVLTSPEQRYPHARWSPSGKQLAVTVWNEKTGAWEGRVLEIGDDLSFKVVHVEPNARAVAWFQGPGRP